MFACWQDYINEFKATESTNPSQIIRMSLTEQELEQFWDNYTLIEMQQLFTITNPIILNHLYHELLPQQLNCQKNLQQAYIILNQDQQGSQQPLFYVYDCRIFRNNIHQKQQNEFISSFQLIFRGDLPVQQKIYEIVQPNQIPVEGWILKVKESGLLRVYGFIKQTMMKAKHRQDKIIMPSHQYGQFMNAWLRYYNSYQIDINVGFFFKAILVLLQNQILLHYYYSLSIPQRSQRMYRRPIRSIDKPKNVEQFTITEQHTRTQTKWQSLKIKAFKLKYRVQQNNDNFLCYLLEEEQNLQANIYQELSEQDKNILQSFMQQKKETELLHYYL